MAQGVCEGWVVSRTVCARGLGWVNRLTTTDPIRMHAPPHDPTQLLKFMLVNGQKSSIERERHGQSFLRFGNTEVGM